MSSDHDRGTYTHPEDGKTYRHPSSLESPHHIGPDGAVVYSKAQIEAMERARAMRPDADDAAELPAFVSYVHPVPHIHEPDVTNSDSEDAAAMSDDAEKSPPSE